jgi:hypothetical protein
MLEKPKEAINNGQSRENQRGNQQWTIQRKPKRQSTMDNPEMNVTDVSIGSINCDPNNADRGRSIIRVT